jgi:lipid II:glycine glycyltransferase (peptidoglycan interpeptide bridge formation enzyme)
VISLPTHTSGDTSVLANRGRDEVKDTPYTVRVSSDSEDREWDAFLAASAQGHHVQTSLWAQVKTPLGWSAVRLVVKRGPDVVAGAQMLIRLLPLVGGIAYVPRGPVCETDDAGLVTLIIDHLHRIARLRRVQYLVVQPPCSHAPLVSQLEASGFRASAIEVAPRATILLDLSADLNALLAGMQRRCRHYVRSAERKGLAFRCGTEADLPTFYRLHVATSKRQNFSPFSIDYFWQLWRVLAHRGQLKLFLVEHGGEALSAQVVVAFGNTVLAKSIGWSGRGRDLHPNESLLWGVIQWAKSQGFRYYDFEGIEPQTATAILRGEAIPESMQHSPTGFKLRFGGRVTLFPPAYDYLYNPLVHFACRALGPMLARGPMLAKAAARLRTR